MEQGTIHFHYIDQSFHFPQRTHLKSFIRKLFKKEGAAIEALNFIFCSDDYLLQINHQYLKHDTYTDIITFQLSESRAPIISDIFISIDRVRENAQGLSTPFLAELYRVVFHGCLHLCGYKDKTKSQQSQMRLKENQYLQLYSVPRETKG